VEHAQAAQPTGAPDATPVTGRTPTRAHRGRGGRGKRSAVTVVLPPAAEVATEEAAGVANVANVANVADVHAAAQPVADAELGGTAQPETVPASELLAGEAAGTTPPTFEAPSGSTLVDHAAGALMAQVEPSAPPPEAHPTEAPPEAHAAGTSTRRYRFERRTPATQHRPAGSARPERLSGRFAASIPGAPSAAPEQTSSEEASDEWPTATESVLTRAPAAPPEPVFEPHVLDAATSVAAPPTGGNGESAAATGIAEQRTGTAGEETPEAASRRRRRRRRSSGRSGAEESETLPHGEPSGAAALAANGGNGFEPPYAQAAMEEGYPPYAPYVPGTREPIERTQAHQPWSISQAQQQISQPSSPFGAPEPSSPHGFGPQPRGVAQPYHEPLTRPLRTDREAPPISPNQLAQVISSALTQQTDRLISELRRQVATPPAITVAMPPSISTERVGVFVDVANLLYSARNMRMAVDFGRLLEFLRGNRRLIRAHAYAPTSPEPNAEQAFLSVVKGVGYRITTKNYKTFSSGAKKADLDLDMCMDIVRLVDAGAIDTLVLVSGDSDFLPVLEWCSDRGLRIEVAAFEDAVSAILRQSCDLFVNLSLVPDIRA